MSVPTKRSFGGGFRFRRYSGQPAPAVETLPVPARVTIPLQQGFGGPTKALVGPGDKVRAGQIIGRDDATLSSPVHATVTGTVAELEHITPDGLSIPALVIASDGTDAPEPLPGHSARWQELPQSAIEELLYLSGVTGLAREGIPTRFHSSVAGPDATRHVIITQAACDVFNPSPAALLPPDAGQDFVEGLAILRRLLPQARFHVCFGSSEHTLLERLGRLLAQESEVSLHSLEQRYPQEASELLVNTVLKEDFPFGFTAANVGIVIMDIQAVLAAQGAVVRGRAVLDRVLALSGTGFVSPCHVRVRVGTPLATIVKDRLIAHKTRLVLDSVLAGSEQKDFSLPVDRTLTQLIALPENDRRQPFAFARPGFGRESFSRSFVPAWLPVRKEAETNRHGDERPCIQCGWCARVCPVRIIPHLIYRQARVGVNELLVRYGTFNCIDCNLCTFTCPSKIDLARLIRAAKEQLLEVGCDNSTCIVPKFDLRGVEEYKGVKSVR
jgi:Na(+)-translocating NADH:ubiquinone oxidoreductase A subunit